MNDTQLTQLCFVITIAGIVALALTYEPEFENSTITELGQKENSKGIIFGRIEAVIENYPITLFTLNDGNTALIYYPRATALEQNDFVKVYAENRPEQQPQNNSAIKKAKRQLSLYAQKVEKQ
ncbi:Uncharacterised protein [uncultured archaeon]|nr:Uncharacterised protein [uncultured archaeon]